MCQEEVVGSFPRNNYLSQPSSKHLTQRLGQDRSTSVCWTQGLGQHFLVARNKKTDSQEGIQPKSHQDGGRGFLLVLNTQGEGVGWTTSNGVESQIPTVNENREAAVHKETTQRSEIAVSWASFSFKQPFLAYLCQSIL